MRIFRVRKSFDCTEDRRVPDYEFKEGQVFIFPDETYLKCPHDGYGSVYPVQEYWEEVLRVDFSEREIR